MKVNFLTEQSAIPYQAKVVVVYHDYDTNLIPTSLSAELKRLSNCNLFSYAKNAVRKFQVDNQPFYIAAVGKKRADASFEDLRFLAFKLFGQIRAEKFSNIAIKLQDGDLDKAKCYAIFAEFAALSQYSFDRFKSEKLDYNFDTLFVLDNAEAYQAAINEAIMVAAAQNATRYLVDEPANLMTPAKIAEMAVQYGKESGFEVEVHDEAHVRELGMHAYLAVAQGSTKNPLKFIVMRYRGASAEAPIYGLVGKGLAYDSGGYSLKPTTGMVDMKMDMGGSATVIGAMKAIADAKLKVNVTAVVASCQNLIGPDAYFPGDIIKTMNGKTVFIGNTDAEGRLTLIDAITYIIRKEKVISIFDFATLTGAAIQAFGNVCAASLSNNDALYEEYDVAAKNAGEKVWRMPAFAEYSELVKHKDADLTNSAGAPGMITAGMFLGEFVENTPWVHVDIAPIAYLEKAVSYYNRGATGYGVKTCYQFMKSKQQ